MLNEPGESASVDRWFRGRMFFRFEESSQALQIRLCQIPIADRPVTNLKKYVESVAGFAFFLRQRFFSDRPVGIAPLFEPKPRVLIQLLTESMSGAPGAIVFGSPKSQIMNVFQQFRIERILVQGIFGSSHERSLNVLVQQEEA